MTKRLSNDVLKNWLLEIPKMEEMVSAWEAPITVKLTQSAILLVLKQSVQDVLKFREGVDSIIELSDTLNQSYTNDFYGSQISKEELAQKISQVAKELKTATS